MSNESEKDPSINEIAFEKHVFTDKHGEEKITEMSFPKSADLYRYDDETIAIIKCDAGHKEVSVKIIRPISTKDCTYCLFVEEI